MLKRLRSWLEERTGVAARDDSVLRPVGQPAWERLEPRILLDAALGGAEPPLSLGLPLNEPVVAVDLQQESDSIELAGAEIFSVEVLSSPAEQFTGGADSFDLAYKALLFTPEGAGYKFAVRSITELPTSPEGGTRLTLDDDDGVLVSLELDARVVLYGQSYDTFYIGSNGYITFTQSDTSYAPTLDKHFDLPRIAVLYDDFNPTVGGQIGYRQLPDRVVVTWEQVPDYSNGGECTFQVTMYFDGRIELAWLAVASPDGIVGLSHGTGLADGFVETDFSRSGSLTAPEITVLGNGLSIVDGDAVPSGTNWTDFGSVAQGAAAISRTFLVRNDGTATLTLGAITVPTGFTLTKGLSSSLAPGESDAFTVQLDAAVAGTKAGDISFVTNDADENPFNFRITGFVTAMPAPEITVLGNGVSIIHGDTTPSPSDRTDFGSVAQGAAAISRTFTVRNDGAVALTLEKVTVPTGFTLTKGLSGSLAPGASDTFTVRLDTAVAGTKTGDISVANDDPDESPFSFRITGTVIAGPEITVLGNGVPIADGDTTPSPGDHTDFGSGVQYGITPSRTFTVRNDGEATLTLGAVTVPAGFTLIEGLSGSLAPGASDTFTVRLDPMTVGVKSGDILFTTNDADENPFNFRITGEVVAAIPSVVVSVAPFSVPEDGAANLVFTFTRSGDTGSALTVNFSVGGTATYGTDYTQSGAASFSAGAGTVLIPKGSGTATVTIDPTADTIIEPNETVVLTVTSGMGYRIGAVWAATGTIANDDMPLVDPSNLTAVVASGSQINLSWSDTSNGETGFRIERKAGESGTWSEIATVGANVTTYQDTGLAAGTIYYYRVCAYNAASSSGYASETDGMTSSPVYRFWSPTFRAHFYTISAEERDHVMATWPKDWSYEGIAYYAFVPGQQPAGTVPVYRFWSGTFQGHFYTASESERDTVIAKWSSDWTYEGIAYYAYAEDQRPTETRAVYRFWSPTFRHHFYTISLAERDHVMATWPKDWTFEGDAWYTYEA